MTFALIAPLLAATALFVNAQVPARIDLYGGEVDDHTMACFWNNNKIPSYNVRVGHYSEGYDENATETLRQLYWFGADDNDVANLVNVYVEVCPKLQNSLVYITEVNNQIRALEEKMPAISRVWLSVSEQKPNGKEDVCWYQSADDDVQKNIDSIRDAVLTAASASWHAGIRTSRDEWTRLTGNNLEFSQLPLLWLQNGTASLEDDWQAFGGWNVPTVRQYNMNTTLCGRSVSLNYAPSYYCGSLSKYCDNRNPCCADRNDFLFLKCLDNVCTRVDGPNKCASDADCTTYEKCDASTGKCLAVDGQACGYQEDDAWGKLCVSQGCNSILADFQATGQTCCLPAQCANSSAAGYVDCNAACATIFGGGTSGTCGGYVSPLLGPNCMCKGHNTGSCKNVVVPSSIARDYNCDACECVGNGKIQCYGCCNIKLF